MKHVHHQSITYSVTKPNQIIQKTKPTCRIQAHHYSPLLPILPLQLPHPFQYTQHTSDILPLPSERSTLPLARIINRTVLRRARHLLSRRTTLTRPTHGLQVQHSLLGSRKLCTYMNDGGVAMLDTIFAYVLKRKKARLAMGK